MGSCQASSQNFSSFGAVGAPGWGREDEDALLDVICRASLGPWKERIQQEAVPRET